MWKVIDQNGRTVLVTRKEEHAHNEAKKINGTVQPSNENEMRQLMFNFFTQQL